MIKKIVISLLVIFSINAQSQSKKEMLNFDFEGFTLNGILNYTNINPPKGIVLIVHGSGSTNAVAQDWYADVRDVFNKVGYHTYMWDKMGCGNSEGVFNYNQSVESSADEVIAAIKTLKQKQIPGAKHIGLWGISRAGWINPLVVNKYKDIKFWVSVSGVDAKENFNYLLQENLQINGQPKDSINLIVNELKEGVRLTHSGASFDKYMNATKNLRENRFMKRFNNGTKISEEDYYAYQKTFMKEKLDSISGLQIYIENFDQLLSTINCPVLALFGEKDKNVDWQKTKKLYQTTIGKNDHLTVKSFPDCNHNIFKSNTGGFYEFQDHNLPWDRCDGFLKAMGYWLEKIN